MKKQTIKLLTVTLFAWGAASAQAQMNHGTMHGNQNQVGTAQNHAGHTMQDHSSHAMPTDNQQVVSAIGVIKKIEENKMRMTLDHEPIEALGWPKMVMPFKVADHSLFEGLNVGDQVTFELKGEATIISIKKM